MTANTSKNKEEENNENHTTSVEKWVHRVGVHDTGYTRVNFTVICDSGRSRIFTANAF